MGKAYDKRTPDPTRVSLSLVLMGPTLSVHELSLRSRLSPASAYSTALLDVFPKAVVNDDAMGVTFR